MGMVACVPELVCSRNRFKSLITVRAEGYRSSRFLCMAFWMMASSSVGIARFTRDGGSGFLCRMPSNSRASVVPVKACLPVAIS